MTSTIVEEDQGHRAGTVDMMVIPEILWKKLKYFRSLLLQKAKYQLDESQLDWNIRCFGIEIQKLS